jgi:hypothetical protein
MVPKEPFKYGLAIAGSDIAALNDPVFDIDSKSLNFICCCCKLNDYVFNNVSSGSEIKLGDDTLRRLLLELIILLIFALVDSVLLKLLF